MSANQKYVPALSFRWLTPLYDALIDGPMSMSRMRRDLLAQTGDLGGKKILVKWCSMTVVMTISKDSLG